MSSYYAVNPFGFGIHQTGGARAPVSGGGPRKRRRRKQPSKCQGLSTERCLMTRGCSFALSKKGNRFCRKDTRKPLRGAPGKGDCRVSRQTTRKPCVGSRAQVMHGNALRTSGGLRKKDLKYNKSGKIVSRKKSALGKKMYKKNGLSQYKAAPFQ